MERHLDSGEVERRRTYHRWQLRAGLAGLALTALYLIALLATGAAGILRDAIAGATAHWWLQLAALLGILGAAYRLLTLPLAWFGGFWLPRRFGLSHQPLSGWLADGAKASAIGAALALGAAEIVYAFLRVTRWWWVASAVVLWAVTALLTLVAPVWLVPLFYRLSPLGEPALAERLLALSRRVGAPAIGVWVADHSRKGRTANAAVTGLGRTRRIIVFDTLLRDFTPDEVEAVLAHELGHHVHRDLWRGLAVQAGVIIATLAGVDLVLRVAGRALGLDSPGDLAGLPLLALALLAATLVILPAVNAWSRHCERQADDFAVRIANRPRAFIEAMDRLADLNLAERDPRPLKEFLLYSHPSVERRIARAEALLASSG